MDIDNLYHFMNKNKKVKSYNSIFKLFKILIIGKSYLNNKKDR